MNTTALCLPADVPDIILNDWLQERADELEALVAPFRRSRCRGHHSLFLLLDDPETRPAITSQLKQLSGFLSQLYLPYVEAHAIASIWAEQYLAASPDQQPALRAIHDPSLAARLLDALQLLNNEINADLLLFKKWAPEAFADDPAHIRL